MLDKILSAFSSGTSQTADFSVLKTDMHSHLLPGIDDGADTMEHAVEMVRGLHEMGFKKLITTPHVMVDYYKNTSSIILSKRDVLRAAVEQAGISIEIEAAAEYLIDDGFSKLLRSKEVLTFGKEQYLLFEFGFFNRPAQLESSIFEIASMGHKPVLAHPERYPYLTAGKSSNLEEFYKIKELGALLQVNLRSLSGDYGKPVQKTAMSLVKAGLVDFVGTDLHRARQLTPVGLASRDNYFAKLITSGKLRNSSL